MRSIQLLCLCSHLCLGLSVSLLADEDVAWPPAAGHSITIGRTDSGAPLEAWLDQPLVPVQDGQPRILAVVDVGTHRDEYEALRQHAAKAQADHKAGNAVFAIIFVPPSALPNEGNTDRLLSFPPQGSAYNTPGERTAAAIWRFAAWYAPDLVIDLHSAQVAEFQATLRGAHQNERVWSKDSLAAAVRSTPIAGIGGALSCRISSSIALGTQESNEELERYAGLVDQPLLKKTLSEGSELKQAVARRVRRRPAEVVDQLLAVYGNDLKSVMYQPALAVMARLETARLRGNEKQHQRVVEILTPYLTGDQIALTENANGSHFAGHMVFAEWARVSGDQRAIDLVRRVAERGFDKNGDPLRAMPSHSEMSDAVFMACPILVAAAELTGEARYLDMAQRHFRFMKELCLRPDGLYRHSPLCEAAWGRGNGFPALGLALSLTSLDRMLTQPQEDSFRAQTAELRGEMRQSFEQHMNTLVEHQDITGMWQQVVDEPVSYREMTSTCMIGFALTRGVQQGWLKDLKFTTAADRAWEGVKARTGEQGELLDVCTGTGKQKRLEDYYDRTAILGRDERGGAMALLFAVERLRVGSLSADE